MQGIDEGYLRNMKATRITQSGIESSYAIQKNAAQRVRWQGQTLGKSKEIRVTWLEKPVNVKLVCCTEGGVGPDECAERSCRP